MNAIIKQLKLIERIDQLIRLQATGSAPELASRLEVSKTTLYHTIKIMKALNAPIEYNIAKQHFVYTKEVVGFQFGFYEKRINDHELNLLVG